MEIKKEYQLGDTVWIYGIGSELTKGTVVKTFLIDYPNVNTETYYVIHIPTSIEPLLEIRNWETISQDNIGPVGGLRFAFENYDSTRKVLAQGGISLPEITNKKPTKRNLKFKNKSKS